MNCLECVVNSDPAIGGDPALPIRAGTLKGIHKSLCVECVVCNDHSSALEDDHATCLNCSEPITRLDEYGFCADCEYEEYKRDIIRASRE